MATYTFCYKYSAIINPCLSLLKDKQEQNIDSQPNIVTSDIDINEEFNKFKERFLKEFRDLKTAFFTEINSYKKLVSHEMLQVTSQNSEITRLSGDIFFLKEQIRNKENVIDSLLSQLSKRDDVLLRNRWPAIKRKTGSVQAVVVERRFATTMITSSKSAAATTTNRQIQTKSKMKISRKALPVKQSSTKKKKRRIQSTKTL